MRQEIFLKKVIKTFPNKKKKNKPKYLDRTKGIQAFFTKIVLRFDTKRLLVDRQLHNNLLQ